MPAAATSMSSREFNQGTGNAKKAACSGPVYITDRGRPAFVLMSYDHYQQLLDDQPSLVDLLSLTPGVGDIELEFPKLDDTGKPAVFD
ncbi:type II toxin-antitoxin system Phd/YefM family antitoxin [Candidatus Poriferisocius sp.]|uniref:type II toxin-antitoxin system Phd/YefM family antitoxin n=1 Tax=Candidatus Poriferisocius sp. TaxID=3101276 RepID=UPI003B51E086